MATSNGNKISPEELERVRAELHGAIDRARTHLEWTEIVLLLLSRLQQDEGTKDKSGPEN